MSYVFSRYEKGGRLSPAEDTLPNKSKKNHRRTKQETRLEETLRAPRRTPETTI